MKKKTKQKLATISSLARRFERDRGTIRRILTLSEIEPVKRNGQSGLYNEQEAIAATEHYFEDRGQTPATKELKQAKLQQEVRKLRIANNRKETELVAVSALDKAAEKTMRHVSALLESKLEEWAQAVPHLDIPGARGYGRKVHDEIVAELKKCAAFWRI